MLDIVRKGTQYIITTEKKDLIFDESNDSVTLDGLEINFPGEYEKSEILSEVTIFEGKLVYKFYIDGYNLVILTSEHFENFEQILPFFGDVDVLLMSGTKNSVKLYENIEAKIVIPYGEAKDVFLNALGQHKEEVSSYRVKGEILGDTTEFVNLV